MTTRRRRIKRAGFGGRSLLLRHRGYHVYCTLHRHFEALRTGTGRWTRIMARRPEWNKREKEMDVTKAPGAASKGTRLLGCLLRADPQVYERVAPVPLYPVAPAKAYVSSHRRNDEHEAPQHAPQVEMSHDDSSQVEMSKHQLIST